MNENLFLLINLLAGHSHLLDLTMIALAKGGVYLFILTEVYLYFFKNRKNEAVFAFYAVVVGLFMAFLTGLFYFHNRPFMDGIGKMIMYHAPENSFPSEHTVFMSSIAFMFLYLKNMRALGAILLVIAIISGLARVFVGVHYPFDIAGGIIIGAISAYIVYLLRVYIQVLNDLIFKIDNFLLGRFKNENK
jgi:undecaprenyl-diphosphatase